MLITTVCLTFILAVGARGQDAEFSLREPSRAELEVSVPKPPAAIRCHEESISQHPAGDNQLANPTFEGEHNSRFIPSWSNAGGGNGLYVISRGSLTKNKTTTGYAVKWGPVEKSGAGLAGVSGFIEQVVPSRGATLTVKITVVQGRASVANYNVLARNDGEDWRLVWQPITIEDMPGRPTDWHYLEASTTLNRDFDEYKVQLEARWDGENALGVKWGDAWFSSE